MSHTQALVEESISRVLEHLEESCKTEISTLSIEQIFSPPLFKTTLERFLNKLGYHLAKAETIRKLERKMVSSNEKLCAVQTFVSALKDFTQFDRAYELLADETSKEVFDWCIQFRVALSFIGNTGNQLFLSPVEELAYFKGLEEIRKKGRSNWFKIEGLKLKSTPDVLFGSFIAEQYRLPGIAEPEKGDWVLDIGGLFGETSFYFSKYVGEEGQVFCFEPVSENYRVLLENLAENGTKNIVPVNLAVGETSGEIRISGSGGGAAHSDSGKIVSCTSIDDFVRNNNLARVDMIKMDIEGYEMNALQGAVETLKDFKPKLAISVYHGGEDLAAIPLFIEDLGLGYRMYLRHFQPVLSETILFATTKHPNGTSLSL
ncbi:MAG: FkbM family methyltransferase [Caldiserica bacterium]|jgi:FkbM family methyltransferase|nr:FkbM family methyltransferase [Caldisericota bacterium]